MVNKSVEKSRAERIALHYKGFISSLQSWLELRIELAGHQYLEQILQNKRVVYVVLLTGLSVVLAVTFLSVAAALGTGGFAGKHGMGLRINGCSDGCSGMDLGQICDPV